MGPEARLWRTRQLTLVPTGSGRDYGVEVKAHPDSVLATCDADGVLRDESGELLLSAPLRWEGRGEKPTDCRLEIKDAGGAALGTGRVTRYGVGPRSRKATVEVEDAKGGPPIRLEPRDRRGEQLALTRDGAELATLSVQQVKMGFLRKARVYTLHVEEHVPESLDRLVLALTIRYDAVLNAVVAASASDRD